ncbi:Inosine triphosphate pyrophosphatase [Tetrabaena socialis]|uniref:Inosine triphosphate pyrophosphatase n=1 Tax=Tetrabaena socialis TaxID=47790 RepID=A0A2J8AIK8_9CHLO|nr:Inosine triphosphate pyrophosphatase [Tetrabaena socialis]|eukprot:PNH12352.1 Inosine triphosphate pyrophosphatase [Tetrabaena socialis]
MATPAKVFFATGNKKKLEEVTAILASGQALPFVVEAAKLDLPELQASRRAGLLECGVGFEDKTAYAQCIFAYTPGPDYEPIVFVGRTPGRIVAARGPSDFGWDPVFEPEGFTQTYAELDKGVKNTISHRYRSLDLLRTYLLEHASK